MTLDVASEIVAAANSSGRPTSGGTEPQDHPHIMRARARATLGIDDEIASVNGKGGRPGRNRVLP
jgi:hypothetical protein